VTDARPYVAAVLALYRRLPNAAARPRPADRLLAAAWHRRGIPLDLIEAALRLATARRQVRDPDAPPLPAVRSLHYYQPVVKELLGMPRPERYVSYLRDRLAAYDPSPTSPPGAPSKNDVSR